MSKQHLLSLADLSADELAVLVERSVQHSSDASHGSKSLEDMVVGVYFRRPSTRTRTSFTVGAHRLGADVVMYGPSDLQITTGESLADTGRVLSGYLDALVVRTNDDIDDMKALASQNDMAVINAMSEGEHPTQAIADLSTIQEEFGYLDGIHVLYVGEGNNSAAALALAVSLTPGMKITFVTPPGYGLLVPLLERAQRIADKHGSTIEHHHSINRLPQNVDVVYATRWQTCGEMHTEPNWKDEFWPFSVTRQLMKHVSKSSGTVFMHDLPAVRGEDVESEVLDGPQSIAWRQAEHKMFSAMAVLQWCAAPVEHRELAPLNPK